MTIEEWKVTFGKRLQTAIKNSGMERKDVAAKANISEASLSQYINGHQVPTTTAAINLSIVLNADPDFLFDFSEVVK